MQVWQGVRTEVLSAAYAVQAISAKDLVVGIPEWPIILAPVWPFAGVCFYLLVKDVLKRLCTSLGTTGKSQMFKQIALVHNLLLCSFSLWSSWNVWSLTIKHLQQYGMVHVYCNDDLWNDGLAFWGMLFYISKYWELVDTMLLIWKQRQPSFLQVYHHSVTIICAYWLQVSHSQVMFLFVGLNATVHTVMYAYYALTVLGVRVKGKSLITVMQMIQFCVGNAAAFPTFVLKGGQCACTSQKIAVAGIMIHAIVLTLLFANFYSTTYKRPARSEKTKSM